LGYLIANNVNVINPKKDKLYTR